MSARLATVLAAAGAALLFGCSDSSSGTNVNTGSGGSAAGTGGAGMGAGGAVATGTGGSASTGAGGSAVGAGGSVGSGSGGSVFSDAGVSDGGGTGSGGSGVDGGADGGVVRPPCGVVIRPVAYASFDGVPAGPTVKLRVRGAITGTPPDAPPDWMWRVTIDRSGEAVPVTVVDPQDPALIEFPVARAEFYRIQVTVSLTPMCRGEELASATFNPGVDYWVRVTAPRMRPELPPFEATVHAQAGEKLVKTYSLPPGVPVTINPRDAQGVAVVSYVRVSSPSRSWSREGDTRFTAYSTWLAYDPVPSYDLLVIPLGVGAAPPSAPKLLGPRTANFVGAPLVLDPGIAVSGTARIAGGAAVAGATVLLRAGALPSTIGISGSDGAFTLRAREGRFQAVILAPTDSMLPDAQVGAIDLPVPPAPAPALRFAWHAPTTVSLAARFTVGGAPVPAGLAVRIDSEEGALSNVGTLTVDGGAAGTQTLIAAGEVHRRANAGANGTVTFPGLPRAVYRLTALTAVGSEDGGLTATTVDLMSAPGGAVSIDVPLAPKVMVTGRMSNAPAGTRLLVLDDRPELGRTFPPVMLGAGGAFSFRLDPQRAYHLVADPPRGVAARVPLGALETRAAAAAPAIDLGDRPLPGMLPLTGWVYTSPGQTPVPGAVVQVFCLGPGPDCIDNSDRGAKDPLPLGEAVAGLDGAFTTWVPDPAVR